VEQSKITGATKNQTKKVSGENPKVKSGEEANNEVTLTIYGVGDPGSEEYGGGS